MVGLTYFTMVRIPLGKVILMHNFRPLGCATAVRRVFIVFAKCYIRSEFQSCQNQLKLKIQSLLTLLITKLLRLSILTHKCGFYHRSLHGPISAKQVCLIKTTFMGQNWQMGYFWYQEGQEALNFQFQLNQTTLKFWLYVVPSKKFKKAGKLSYWTDLAQFFF